MRILADENVPRLVVASLAEQGHEVAWVAEAGSGEADAALIERAVREDRVVLTSDRDFGRLALRQAEVPPPGVVLLRLEGLSPSGLARAVAEALNSRNDWRGHIAVIEPGRIRLSALPRSSDSNAG